MTDDLCEHCGGGFILPSGVCDHCDQSERPLMTLNAISQRHHEWLREMGWVGNTTPLEQLALIASEIGEAVNECRGEKPTDKVGSELADIILRTLGLAEKLGLDMEQEIAAKMAANRARGTKGRVK